MSKITGDAAIELLKDGNKRFIEGKSQNERQSLERVRELKSEQNPFAIILTCSDSRTPPEIIFDQGIGDLFVIRNAGNVVDSITTASIEYAVAHLGVNLVVIMSHENCGAVKSVVSLDPNGNTSRCIDELFAIIKPSVDEAKKINGDITLDAIKINARNMVKRLLASSVIVESNVSQGKLKVVPGYYSMNTGIVELF